MPNSPTLLEQVKKIEQVCTKTSMIQVEPVVALCAKLREVVEAVETLITVEHQHDMRVFERPDQYEFCRDDDWERLQKALTPMQEG